MDSRQPGGSSGPAAERHAGTGAPGIGGAPLIPQPPIRVLRRQAVSSLLTSAMAGRITTVCAGPGWGKTTAVAAWLDDGMATQVATTAWVTVKAHPVGQQDFWGLALGALRASGSVPADHPLRRLEPDQKATEGFLPVLGAALDSLPEPVLLVLDDAHEIADTDLLGQVTDLVLKHSRAHLLLLSRVVPVVPRHRLRLSGALTEVTADDLAFDSGEIAALARSDGLALSPDQAQLVLDRTAGWPAGVRLALLYAARLGTGALASFGGTHQHVAEFLQAEVLDQADPLTRGFMLRTSIEPVLCGDLAEAIAPGAEAQRILEGLVDGNRFVSALGPDRTWFRYHPLLRDLLMHAHRREDLGSFRSACQAAAQWWSGNGDPLHALHDAAQAEDWDLFGRIYLRAAAPAVVGLQGQALGDLLRRVPYASLPESATAHLEQAGLALLTGDVGAVAVHADRAVEMLGQQQGDDAATTALAVMFSAVRSRVLGDFDQFGRLARRALASLDQVGPFPAEAAYRRICRHGSGVSLVWAGQIDDGRRELMRLIENPETGADAFTLASAKSYCALSLALQGDLEAAARWACDALGAAESDGWHPVLGLQAAQAALAMVHLQRGDAQAAHASCAAGLAAGPAGSERVSSLLLRVLAAQAAASVGQVRSARQLAGAAQTAARGWQPPRLVVEPLAQMLTDVALMRPERQDAARLAAQLVAGHLVRDSCRARLMTATADHERALAFAQAAIGQGEPLTLADRVALVDAWIVVALTRDHEWDGEGADDAVDKALALAGPAGLVRPFLITGSSRLTLLLDRVRDARNVDDPFAAAVLARMPGPEATAPAPLATPLTDREQLMLRILPTMRRNAEIADEFDISINTVKSHLRALYRKLGVRSRREAVERARELGVLTRPGRPGSPAGAPLRIHDESAEFWLS